MGLRGNGTNVAQKIEDPKPILTSVTATAAPVELVYDDETKGRVRCQMAIAAASSPAGPVFAQDQEAYEKWVLAFARRLTEYVLYDK